MCISVYDCHLCGQLGNEIEFRKCGYRRDAAEFLAVLYSSRAPSRTREDNIKLHCIVNACKEVSQLWDDVRIFPDCWACTVQVMRLGEAEAVRHCVRKIRAMEGKEET
jgi:hypothetical protein